MHIKFLATYVYIFLIFFLIFVFDFIIVTINLIQLLAAILIRINYLSIHMHKKKILAPDHRDKKIHARTVGWKKVLARCSLS